MDAEQKKADKKVLVVLDQFEQWLHAKRTGENEELVRPFGTAMASECKAS